mmetsp:Transcript_4153/g.11964  ORF Transcript_4153/g.11964 Transcript_4153/m.11964 type:complete len:210 (-) Transcript_4153:114-743(-)|eukprot:CAMPEP_0176134520 /NCGR_PEP_ID=MMETSP0120_2-20121206/68220_1 /TAXON_ID=160619 /ORGANISM="Kryptoperidinium foliaceum, Strain CCMP 1326" /LENGTH=209 /DNA_ID=CAMNT_0017470173 /DNA_START=70 /DNA_END=699 /DNA_ORIENTATION=-
MKAKDLKILRKKLTKLNKADYDPIASLSKELLEVDGEESNNRLILRSARSSDLSTPKFEELFSLFEKNMGELYRESSWGLNKDEKAEELRHANARYLLVERSSDKKLASFVHYRFDYDDDENPSEAVVYVYEIQVDEEFQRRGLGKKLMHMIEEIASHAEIGKVMLTVFNANAGAVDFYKRLEYSIDPSSPSNFNEPADYEILSRSITQ